MDKLDRLRASQSGYKGHLTWIHHKIDELLSEEVDDYSVTALMTAMEQLRAKGLKISQVDE